jgi:hypothetical protein
MKKKSTGMLHLKRKTISNFSQQNAKGGGDFFITINTCISVCADCFFTVNGCESVLYPCPSQKLSVCKPCYTLYDITCVCAV